ncbi:MAG TPA: tail fiber protein [Tepidisphaeraceae bacterium]|nr:tail fiber protein [Tepidisphaeraceae bacterium]
MSAPALALDTNPTGGGQPFYNMQPSLAIQFAVQDQGYAGSGVPIRMFAYEPARWNILTSGAWQSADGSLVSVGSNPQLFDQLGTTYGGDGNNTFAVPDLRGRTPIGDSFSSPRGHVMGQNIATLSTNQMPVHSHTHGQAVGGSTTTAGGGASFDNMQASLPINWSIEYEGIYPNSGPYAFDETVIGRLVPLAATPTNGWEGSRVPASGALVSIAQNSALFTQLGTWYGGNGQTTFALPDLDDTTARGAGDIGAVQGISTVTLDLNNLPAHSHDVPSLDPTGSTGSGTPVNNMQRSLDIRYMIALQGVLPAAHVMAEDAAYVGEIQAFAGFTVPNGYLLAEGQLLQISQYTALFSLIGTTYGGDGQATFALPDLRERVPIGASMDFPVGSFIGSDSFSLGIDQLPSHMHSLTLVPEPVSMMAIMPVLAIALRRRK